MAAPSIRWCAGCWANPPMARQRSPEIPEILVEIQDQFQAQVQPDWLLAAARATLRACQRPNAALSIQVVDDETVQTYNRTYRQVDAPTDVLSFAAQEGQPPAGEMPPELAAALATELGDLLLGFPYAQRQAQQFGHSLRAELQLLVVHGCLHLLGYDHDTDQRQAAMWQQQAQILAELSDEDLTPRLTAQD